MERSGDGSGEDGEEDSNEPYKGKKSRDPKKDGRWTKEEHARFLEALYMYGKNWNHVHRHIGTRSSA